MNFDASSTKKAGEVYLYKFFNLANHLATQLPTEIHQQRFKEMLSDVFMASRCQPFLTVTLDQVVNSTKFAFEKVHKLEFNNIRNVRL